MQIPVVRQGPTGGVSKTRWEWTTGRAHTFFGAIGGDAGTGVTYGRAGRRIAARSDRCLRLRGQAAPGSVGAQRDDGGDVEVAHRCLGSEAGPRVGLAFVEDDT